MRCSVLFVLFGVGLWAQVTPQTQCVFNAGVTPTVRSEGLTEQVGDLLLTCTGGTPALKGAPVPKVNITVFLNTNVTSRIIGNGTTNASEALLLIDEPTPSAQKICLPPYTACPITGTDGQSSPYVNSNIFPGTVTPQPAPAGSSSVFQGSSHGNAVEWLGVPIDPPSTNGMRVVRITNIRANAAQLGASSTLPPTQIAAFISITGSNPPAVINPQQPVAVIQPGLMTTLLRSGTGGDCPTSPTITTFSLGVQENFPFALKKRNIGQTLTNLAGDQAQNVPGMVYNAESAFVPGASAYGGPSLGIGEADTPTFIHGVFKNVPQGLQFLAPLVTPLTDQGANPGGTLLATGGSTAGSNMAFGPNSNGQVDMFWLVGDRTNASGVVGGTLTVTVNGAASVLPAQIQGILGFPQSANESNILYAPGSSNFLPVPGFGSTQTGIATPPISPYLRVAALTPCNPVVQSLNTDTSMLPVFQTFSGPLVPASFNYGVVSPGLPVSNVAVTKDPAATWLNVSLNQTTTPVTATLTVNPVTTTAAQSFTTNLVFSSKDIAGGGNLTVPVNYKATPGPWFTRYGFANAASYVSNVVAPGEMFLLTGYEFGPSQFAGPVLDAAGRPSTAVGNTQVLFDGQLAPLYYSVLSNGVGYVAGFAPFELEGKTQTNVQVVYNGTPSPAVTLSVVDAIPALFTEDTSGSGQGAILNQDGSYNSASNPESIGNVVMLFGTGGGQTIPGGQDGMLAGGGASIGTQKLPFKVFIDGIQATDIPYLGPVPGEVEGLFQISVRIPAGVRSGSVPVIVQVEDKLTQPGVSVAVK